MVDEKELMREEILAELETKVPKRKTLIGRSENIYIYDEGRIVINLRKLLEMYKQEPFTKKAVRKRSKDLFGAGLTIEGLTSAKNKAAEEFLNGLDAMSKLSGSAQDTLWSGNGFAEIIFEEDPSINAMDAPTTHKVVGLAPISPRITTLVEDRTVSDTGIKRPTYGQILYFLLDNRRTVRQTLNKFTLSISSKFLDTYISRARGQSKHLQLVHPERVLHMTFETLSDSHVGISALEELEHVIDSKVSADISLGEIIAVQGKGIMHGKNLNSNPNDFTRLEKDLKRYQENPKNRAYVVTDATREELEIIGFNGAALNPEPYYKVMTENICTGIGVPQALLIGTQAGSVSGSDLNLTSYFEELDSEREASITPLIKTLLNHWHLDKFGSELPPETKVTWNKLYTDDVGFSRATFMYGQTLKILTEASLIPEDAVRKKLATVLDLEFDANSATYREPKEKKSPFPEDPGNNAGMGGDAGTGGK